MTAISVILNAYRFALTKGGFMKSCIKLLPLVVLCCLTSVGHAATKATPIVFAKGSYCGSYTGEISNSKTFSLFLLKNQYLNVHYNANEVKIRVTDKAGKVYKNDHQENGTYMLSPIPKKGNYYITVTPKPKYRHSWQKIEFCAEDIDL